MIEVRALARTFPDAAVPALDGVSFEIGPGEAVALAGRNGAGKTSLLDVLATLLLPSAGRASVAGSDVVAGAARVRRITGYAGSGPRGLYTRLTARQNLAFFGALHPGLSDVEARIGELTEELELAAFIDAPVRTCSDGMLQRLIIARALLGRPQVLLLDEPARALDAVARGRVARLVGDRLSTGSLRAVLFATHDLDALPGLATRAIVLARGRIVHDGDADPERIGRLIAREPQA